MEFLTEWTPTEDSFTIIELFIVLSVAFVISILFALFCLTSTESSHWGIHTSNVELVLPLLLLVSLDQLDLLGASLAYAVVDAFVDLFYRIVHLRESFGRVYVDISVLIVILSYVLGERLIGNDLILCKLLIGCVFKNLRHIQGLHFVVVALVVLALPIIFFHIVEDHAAWVDILELVLGVLRAVEGIAVEDSVLNGRNPDP